MNTMPIKSSKHKKKKETQGVDERDIYSGEELDQILEELIQLMKEKDKDENRDE